VHDLQPHRAFRAPRGVPGSPTLTFREKAYNNDRRVILWPISLGLVRTLERVFQPILSFERSSPLSHYRIEDTCSFVITLATAIVVISPLDPKGVLKVGHLCPTILTGTNLHYLLSSHSHINFRLPGASSDGTSPSSHQNTHGKREPRSTARCVVRDRNRTDSESPSHGGGRVGFGSG